MIKVDLSDFKRFASDLKVLRERELPHAVRNTLNTAAFEGRKLWLGEMRSQLTLRNRYTESSARVEKASGTKIEGMAARLGSVASYMDDTEDGAKQVGRGHVGFAVPTRAAAGQLRSKTRTRPIRKASFLASVRLAPRLKKGRRQVRNAAAIHMALKRGDQYVYLDTGKKKGIFRLDGAKRGLRVRMLYDLSKRQTQAKPKPTLGKAMQALRPRLERIGREAVLEQLKRRVFGAPRRRG